MSDLYQSLLDMQAAHSKAQQQLTAERAHSERLAEALRDELRTVGHQGYLAAQALAAHEERKKA